VVDTEAAIRLLPEPYQRALKLGAEGLDDAAVAERLGLEPEAGAALIRVARAKLAKLSVRP
jgi:hypothetical protein